MTRTLLFRPHRVSKLERFALFLGIFLPYCVNLAAIDPHQPITQMHHTAWGAKPGVIGGVFAIAQTSDGFIWVGTTGGLLRFDGSEFERYKPDEGSFPQPNWASALLATPDGGLWIGYLNGGASFLQHGRLKNFGDADGLPRGRVRSLTQDPDGTIWIATPTGLGNFDGRQWRYVDKNSNLSGLIPKSPSSVAANRQGLWVSDSNKGVFFLPRGTHAFQQLTPQPVPGYLPTFAEAGEKATWLWVPESLSIERYSPHLPAENHSSKGFANSSGMFLVDRDGSGWMMTRHDGVLRIPDASRLQGQISLNDPSIQKFSETEGLTNATVLCAMEDREGDIWVATVGGLDRFRPRNAAWTELQSVSTQRMQLVTGDKGEVLASSPQGLWDARTGKPVRGSPHGIQYSFRDPDGSIWFWSENSGTGDLWRWTGGPFLEAGMSPSPRVGRDPAYDSWVPINGPVRALTRDGSGDLWVSVRGRGIFRQHDGVWGYIQMIKGMRYLTAYGATCDSQGRVWLAFPELREIGLWDHGAIQVFSAETGLNIGAVTQIAYSEGRIWAGGETGLAVYGNGKFHTVEPAGGTGFGLVAGIAGSPSSGLWLSTPSEIVHIPQSEVSKVIQDSSHKVRYETFDPDTDLAERPSATSDTPAVMGADGILWVATPKGVTRVDPSHLHRNQTPPQIAIRNVTANGRSYPIYVPITLPPHTANLRIGYSVLSFPIPERVRSRYRLLGNDKEWHDGGNRVDASFDNLGPGRYTLQVVAGNNDGVWNEAGVSLEFTIQPAFYQTPWFRLLYVVAIVALVWLIYRLRLRRVAGIIKQRAEARADERVRIARDLHDTLLQGIQGLILHFHLAAQEFPEGSRPRETADRALTTADRIVAEGRDRVNHLRSDRFTYKDLTNAFEAIAADFSYQGTARFSLKTEGRGEDVTSVVLNELHYIGREAISNAFRHSEASEIVVRLKCDPRSVVLTVADNGLGFDPVTQEINPRVGHWGLRGMKERAEVIGGYFECQSKPNKGTQVVVTVPAHRAYRKNSAGRKELDDSVTPESTSV
ncbi:MAG TPA: two-component regulator propeller domain-containing protein [Acidobacteriaceae bacterium]|jgi:signal transduction histidine kinase/ligand-binding sensor domain-containing protein|nr:two-component regulator propeller domain-containing protein [Acidobacteriaceae bacterium]